MATGQTEFTTRQKAGRMAFLAVLYFGFGHLSFLPLVQNVIVTPVLFAPEGIALAFALRYGKWVWPGVFLGQLALALTRGLLLLPALGISAANSAEAVLAVALFRALKFDAQLTRARDLAGLLAMIFFVLQPFSATVGNAILWSAGLIPNTENLQVSWLDWWSGNSLGQMIVAPALLAIFARTRRPAQLAGDIAIPLLLFVPVTAVAQVLMQQTGITSFVVLLVPIFSVLAVYRGMVAVCSAALFIAAAALYATSHGFGPFAGNGQAEILDLNVFLVGLALSGQFLSIFLAQSRQQRQTEDELRAAREQLQRTAYELTESIPVGTYVLEFDAGGNPHFTFLSERFLAMTGLKREEVMANHALALEPMQGPQRAAIESLNREAFATKQRFFWEGEITVRGEKRHVTLESVPRERPGGGMVWEGMVTDVTERRKAEDQLRMVLDNMPVAVAENTLTSPQRITFINEQFTRIFGYTLEDVPTLAAWAEKAYPDPDYRREVFREWDRAAARAVENSGRVESMEFEVISKDGTRHTVIFRAAALEDRLLVTMTDVTERRQTEAALRSLREQIERTAFELTENIPVGTYTMVQPPGGGMAYFSFLSTRFLEMTGLDREAAKANPMNAFACVHPDDHAEWVRKNAYVFEHKLPFKEECRILIDGETRWIRAESAPRDLKDGSVVWEGVLTDITERKVSEQKLAEAHSSMLLAAAAANLGFWRFDVRTGLDEWDEGMARIHGCRLADFDGHWKKFVHPDDFAEVMEETRRMLESEKTFEMEYRVVRPDGTVRKIREYGVVLRDAAGRAISASGVTQDITEEKAAEEREKRVELEHRLDLETKLRTSLSASAVAHEINQPLSAILLQSKMALQTGHDSHEALRLIAREAQRVVVTIEKMKTLLRNVQTEHRAIDLADVMRSVLLYNKGMLARRAVAVRDPDMQAGCRIMGDDEQLQMALTNILRNSAEAIDDSAGERREISIDLQADGDEVTLAIGDSGPGWSGAEQMATPFNTTKTGGTGIGLYVVRTAVENHRGKLIFGKSALGGAEVRMVFPRAA